MTDSKSSPSVSPESTTPATRQPDDAFLAKMRGLSTQPAANGGRLIFALDATASRQPTWDTACQLQAEMFREATAIGSLSVQLVYYRGLSECRASKWVSQPEHLSGLMEKINCRMGHTQLGKILAHARRETELLKVQALVFVGDALEENPDELSHDADELGRLGVPAFMFQEGDDPGSRARLPRDRAPDPWRLLPLRSGRSTSTGRASAGRGGLRRWWDDRACCSPRCGRGQAAEPDEVGRGVR